MGTQPIVPELVGGEQEAVHRADMPEPENFLKTPHDAGEYEAKFLATSQLLEDSAMKNGELVVERDILGKKLGLAMAELGQYKKDLQHLGTAHASEYAGRRLKELQVKLNEIEAVK